MAVSVILPDQTGSTTDYAVPFEYLSRSHVKVTVDGTPVSFTFNSTYMIRISPAPVGTLAIYRETPNGEPVNVFTDGSILVADELNAAFLQSLFVSQEVSDKLPARDSSGSWEFGNRRLVNVASPEADTDAASVGWVKDQYSSGVDAQVARLAAEAARDSSISSKNAASTSETNAANSASAANNSRVAAEEARVGAEAAMGVAIAARDTALEHRNAAASSATSASGSASTASTKAAEASASAAAAATFNPSSYYSKAETDAKVQAGGVPVGASIQWNSLTLPTGFMKENGAAIPIATYPEIDAALYVGDANNATAEACYRCTNPANPSGSRSVTGTHFVLPDMRGEWARGLDDGRGIDPGRTLHSSQADQNKSHTHTGTADSAGSHSHPVSSYLEDGGTSGFSGGASYYQASSTGAAGAHTHNLTIAANGGSEVRVRNKAKLWIIRVF